MIFFNATEDYVHIFNIVFYLTANFWSHQVRFLNSCVFSQVTGSAHLLDDIIEKDDFRQLHGQIVLIGSWFKVAHDRRADTQGRDQKACEDEVSRFAWFLIHQEKRNIFLWNPPEKIQHHQRIEILLKDDEINKPSHYSEQKKKTEDISLK